LGENELSNYFVLCINVSCVHRKCIKFIDLEVQQFRQSLQIELIYLSRSQAVHPSINTSDFHRSSLIFTNRIANDLDNKIAKNPNPNSMAIWLYGYMAISSNGFVFESRICLLLATFRGSPRTFIFGWC
jgi:hypothetical protein